MIAQEGIRHHETACTTPSVMLACPVCRRDFGVSVDLPVEVPLRCAGCGFELQLRDGIWAAMPQERVQYFSRFKQEYEKVRAAEGRGSHLPDYYRSLPFLDSGDPNAPQWKIRATSFRFFLREIVTPNANASQRVLDIGAGNGWLSFRLAEAGLAPVAVDMLVNEFDGLGAAKHFFNALPRKFPRVNAEMDRLPFADAQFDLAVFNASFHYSENFERTLGEAMRCVKQCGKVVILDTPWYEQERDGEEMVRERRVYFQSRFGFPSDALRSLEFLTPSRIAELEESLGVLFTELKPWYGIRWAARPWVAKWKRRRRPSEFRMFVIEVPGR